jgi:hypothetical protein
MKSEEKQADPKVKVDEQVVRKMLKVNPDMRKGRTTFQVKKALESGESLAASDSTAAPASSGHLATSPTPTLAGGSAASELQETIDFFVRGKADKLEELLVSFAERRRALEQEESAAREELIKQVVAFIGLLDENAIAAQGRKALAKHAEFLKKLGLTPADVLARAGRGS